MKRSSIQTTLTVLAASLFLIMLFKVDGTYDGELLNPLDPDSILEMEGGLVHICLPGEEGSYGEKIPFGHYFKEQGSWMMDMDGAGIYEMKAWLGGFDLVSVTNSAIRLRFTKTYFILPEFIDPD